MTVSIFDNNIIKSTAKSEGNKILFFENLPSIKEELKKNNQISILFPNSTQFFNSKINIKEIDFEQLGYDLIPQTVTSGLSEYNNKTGTIIVEESNYGRIFEYDPKTNKILWTFLNANKDKSNYWRMNWSRFYLNNPLN